MTGIRSVAVARTLIPTALLALALGACATAGRPAGDPYGEVNRSLRGERAIVELAGGEVAADVSHVRFAEFTTSWTDERGTRRVPTDQVARVIVVSQPPRHAPWGLILLTGLALAVAFDDPLPLAIAADVALEPFVWGAEISPAVGRVVYAAP